LFAQHNTLKDPPFIRNDLIARRNLLIYLDRELQQQLCGVLHYGLKQDGYLFLGSAETAESTPELFRLIDRDARLYAAKPSAGHAALALPQFAPEHHRAFPLPPPTATTRGGSILPPPLRKEPGRESRHLLPDAT